MLSETPPPIPWLLRGMIARGVLTAITGREGEGKSLVALAFAAAIASGRSDVAGIPCAAGRTLILDAENGEQEIWRRVRALDPPTKGFEFFEVEFLDLRHHLAEVESVLREHEPDLVVIDAWRSMWGGDEDRASEAGPVLDHLRNLVRRYDAGCVLLHHAGWDRARPYRGSTSLGAAVDMGFVLGHHDGDRDSGRRFLRCWKSRLAAKPPDRWLRVAERDGRVFVDLAQAPDRNARDTTKARDLEPRLLEAARRECRGTLTTLAEAVGENAKNRTVRTALNGLVAAGHLKREDDGRYLVAEPSRPNGGVGGVATGAPPLRGSDTPTPPAGDPLAMERNSGRDGWPS